MFTEREAIKEYINYVVSERERLLEEYNKAMARLGKLDEITNIHKEVTESQKEAEIVPNVEGMSLQEAVDKFNSLPQNLKKETVFEYDRQKELVKEQDYQNRSVKRSGKGYYKDVKRVANDIISILKDEPVPIKSGKLIKKLESRGYKLNSPYALIHKAREYDDRIQSPSHGYYQYKW